MDRERLDGFLSMVIGQDQAYIVDYEEFIEEKNIRPCRQTTDGTLMKVLPTLNFEIFILILLIFIDIIIIFKKDLSITLVLFLCFA